MKIIDKYQYPKLIRIDGEDGRKYTFSGYEPVSSVTTILSKTKDMTELDEWRKRIGDEQADREIKYAAAVGTIMHNILENKIFNKANNLKSGYISKFANLMANKIIDNAFHKISNVYAIEKQIFYPSLYAGTIDMVADYNGVMSIVDYKNSRKIKSKEEHLEDYYMQSCAYAQAHNFMFDTDISQVVILMVTRPESESGDIDFSEFIISGDKFRHYSLEWHKRLSLFLS